MDTARATTTPLPGAVRLCLVLACGVSAAGPALALETARVISSTPVIVQQVMPTQVCDHESVRTHGRHYGTGALLGGLAGGVVGNQIGDGGGRAAATVIGIVGGAVIGERLQRSGPDHVEHVRRCTVYTTAENRISHWDVVYEHGGRQHRVQMAHDPGPVVQLQLTPLGALQPHAAPPPPQISHSHITVIPAPVYPAPVFIAVPPSTGVYRGVPHPYGHKVVPQPYPRYHPHGANRDPYSVYQPYGADANVYPRYHPHGANRDPYRR